MTADLSRAAVRVAHAILQRQYEYKRDEGRPQAVAVSELMELTTLSKRAVMYALDELQGARLLDRQRGRGRSHISRLAVLETVHASAPFEDPNGAHSCTLPVNEKLQESGGKVQQPDRNGAIPEISAVPSPPCTPLSVASKTKQFKEADDQHANESNKSKLHEGATYEIPKERRPSGFPAKAPTVPWNLPYDPEKPPDDFKQAEHERRKWAFLRRVHELKPGAASCISSDDLHVVEGGTGGRLVRIGNPYPAHLKMIRSRTDTLELAAHDVFGPAVRVEFVLVKRKSTIAPSARAAGTRQTL